MEETSDCFLVYLAT